MKVRCQNRSKDLKHVSCSNTLFFLDEETGIIQMYCQRCKTFHYFKISGKFERMSNVSKELKTRFEDLKKRNGVKIAA